MLYTALLTLTNMARRSCVTQLLEVHDQIGSHLDSGGQVDTLYLDMSKAFDKVNHNMLLRKLQHHGFGGKLLEWFKSYISNRSQRVTALRATSQLLPVTSGVPQGSILGPVLFLLYVNSLPDSIITSKTATFADDTKIYKPIMSLCDSHLLQDDLSRLVSWSDSVGLIFNSSKCKAQRITRKLKPITYDYTMDRTTLEFTESEKDLGVIVTADLTWSKQVCNQCSKANKMLGFVRRNLRFVKSIPVRRCMYLALVRSHLCYATQV